MTALSNPIDPARFALALEDLSLASLHAKAAELRNSLYHLRHSNAQLQHFADAGDPDCKEAIAENEVVMVRFRERVELLKAEVEKRGMPWVSWDEEAISGGGNRDKMVNGDADVEMTNGDGRGEAHVVVSGEASRNGSAAAPSGSLSDEALQRRMMQQMEDDDEGGLHL